MKTLTLTLLVICQILLQNQTHSAIVQQQSNQNIANGYTDNYYQALYRNYIIETNIQRIHQSNQQNPGFSLSANKFVSYSPDEFNSLLLTAKVPSTFEQIQVIASLITKADIQNNSTVTNDRNGQNGPIVQSRQNSFNQLIVSSNFLNIDWSTSGFVTRVKNQGSCGSCWAFTTISDLQTSYLQKGYRNLNLQQLDLSQQQLVDCSGSFYNYGCRGGWMTNAFAYMYGNPVQTEENYPYTGRDGQQCRQGGQTQTNFTLRNLRAYWKNQNCGLLVDILRIRPVTVAVVADSFYWGFYKSGILSQCPGNINHAVIVTGVRETQTGQNYWIAKNSWGTDWGQNGYIRIDRSQNGGNLCEVCSYPQYSIV